MFKRFPASFRTFWAFDGQNRMKNGRVMAVFQFFAFLSTFRRFFRVFALLHSLSKNDSLLNSGHFDLWMGKIG